MYCILYREPTLLISQKTPCPRTIHVDGSNYFLHFPYLVFVSVLNTKRLSPKEWWFFVYASQSPVRYAEQAVSRLPLPNVYPNGYVCLSNRSSFCTTLDEFHDWAIDRFFTSEFREGELGEGWWRGEDASKWRKAKSYEEVSFDASKPFREWLERSADIEVIVDDFYHDEIEKKAYYSWLAAGQPDGSGDYFWRLAEQETVEKYK
jgi:hypothetical protein